MINLSWLIKIYLSSLDEKYFYSLSVYNLLKEPSFSGFYDASQDRRDLGEGSK